MVKKRKVKKIAETRKTKLGFSKILKQDFLFKKVLSSIKEKPGNFFFMILFDVLFVISVLIFITLLKFVVPQNPTAVKSLFFGSTALILISVVVYYLLLMFIYSFFKYDMLLYIQKFVKKGKFRFKNLRQFFLLNLFIFVLFLVCAMVINFLIVGIKDTYQRSFSFWIIVIFLFLFYIFLNLSHSIFIEEKRVKNVIRLSFRTMFGKIKSYAGFLIHTIGFVILFFILMLILWLIFSRLLQMQMVYAVLFNVIGGIIFYAIILTNRIYFYLAVEKELKNKK